MKDDKRTNAGAPGARDPFADLVRAVEGTPRNRTVGSEPSYGGFEAIEVPQASWEQFSYVPAPASSGSPRIEPVGQAAPPRAASRRTAAEADAEIEEALRGLSQPARPRVNAPAETQSFAPARLDDHAHPTQRMTADDFDELIASELAAMQPTGVRPMDDDDDYLDDGYDDRDDRHVVVGRPRRSLALYAGAAMVAVAAVGGAYAMLGNPSVGGSSGDSLLIKADAEPYKIAPADPGGRSIPNQNKAVYERVASGEQSLAPTQQALVTAFEEPVDLPADEDTAATALPGVTYGEEIPAETSVEVAEAAADTQTLQPRKVRTLTVRPDGTLVAQDVQADEGAPDAAAAPALIAAAAPAISPNVLDPVAGITPAMPLSADVSEMTTASTTPVASAPAAAETQVASLPTVAPTGEGFFVQIASQPSESAARESLDNMTRRFGQIIGGRGMGIQSAEIAGKGTFYRVRVATSTRSEAISLCESLKSAGGSCFVTR